MTDVPFAPAYPKVLTTASWAKAKGLLGRAKGKTGITELLAAAYKTYSTAPWVAMRDYKKLGPAATTGVEAIKQFQKDHAREFGAQFKAVELAFRTLSTDLGKMANDPKCASYQSALKLMATQANQFSYAVAYGSVSTPVHDEASTLIKKIESKKEQDPKKHLNDLVNALNKCITKLKTFKKAPPTEKEYVGLFSQHLRLPGTYARETVKIRPSKDLDVYMKYAEKYWGTNNAITDKTDFAKQVKSDLKALEDALEATNKLLKAD